MRSVSAGARLYEHRGNVFSVGTVLLFVASVSVSVMLICASVFIVAASAASQAPTLDARAIVEKHLAAIGGLESLKVIQSFRQRGVETMVDTAVDKDGKGVNGPFTLEAKRPNRFRDESRVNDQYSLQGSDGRVAWEVSKQGSASEVLTGEEAEEAIQMHAFDGPLVKARLLGEGIVLASVEKLGATKAYKLKLPQKDKCFWNVYIDANTFLEVKREYVRPDERNTVILLSGHKKTGSLVLPTVSETTYAWYPLHVTRVVEKTELNPEIPDERFAPKR